MNDYRAAIDRYDRPSRTICQQLGRGDGLTCSQNLGNNLKQVYFPEVRPVAAMQGLLNDK